MSEPSSFKMGFLYGVIPHIGCILFVLASILGSTLLVSLFKPLIMSAYLFYWILGISFGFSIVSAIIYLYKNKMLSWSGVKQKRGYLSIMLGTTIGINLLLFLMVFPLMGNYVSSGPGNDPGNYSTIEIQVDIPCSGHASLITGEIKTLPGIQSVKFKLPKNFIITFDITTKDQILNLDIFKTYPATTI